MTSNYIIFYENFKSWIYYWIEITSNIDKQQKLWLNKNNDIGCVSSYTELMCSLFDDLNFDEFVETMIYELNFPDKLKIELVDLKNALHNYTPEDENRDDLVINDLKWLEVVEKAKKVIFTWNKLKKEYKLLDIDKIL